MHAHGNEMILNRRLTGRVSTANAAVLLSKDGLLHLDCILSNISPTGAQLLVTENAVIPEDVVIFFADSGIRWPCRVVRHSGMEIGVRFK